MLERAEFSRRAATMGLTAAMAAAAMPLRATGSLSGMHDIRTYGARGDGRAIDSIAINRAIEAASAAGGGTIIVPPGRYLCFSIRLKSHITLVLMHGSVIMAANPDEHDGRYDLPEGVFEEQLVDYGLAHFHNSLIYGDGVSDIAIIGHGLIHGTGLDREGPPPRWHGLPGWRSPAEQGLTADAARRAIPLEMHYEGRGNKAIGLTGCRNIVLKDFSIVQGGHFACYLLGCTNIRIDGLTVDTDRDGIDLDCCRDARISNCLVNAPKDDAIVLKSSYALKRPIFCEDIQIIGCKTSGYLLGTVLDGSFQKSPYLASDNVGVLGRIKLGTDSVAGFRNILVADCICENSRGLQLGAIDGGILEDVTFRNINLVNPVNHPIFLRLSARNRAPRGAGVAKVRRVRFSDIHAAGARTEFPCGVVGIVDGSIEDVSFRGVEVTAAGGGTKADATRSVPERRNSSLEPSFMGILPAHGLYARHVRKLMVSDCSFAVAKADARPTIVLENVQGAAIDSLSTPLPRASAVRVDAASRNIALGTINSFAGETA